LFLLHTYLPLRKGHLMDESYDSDYPFGILKRFYVIY
jgi:hypothetical protein